MKNNLSHRTFSSTRSAPTRKVLCVVIALVATSCIAQADTVYTSQSAWNAAVSGSTTINFEGIAIPSSYVNEPPSFLQGGDTFGIGPSAPGGSSLFVIGDNFYGFGYAVVSSQAASGTLDLKVTLPSPVTALAFDYIVGTGNVTITGSDGLNQAESAPGVTNFLFFGVTDPGGISSVDITQAYSLASESVNMKDFSYATANPATVPEPSSLLFSSVVVVGMIGLVRRRRQPKSLN